MLENDITDVLDLTFTAESDFFGKTEVRHGRWHVDREGADWMRGKRRQRAFNHPAAICCCA
jgi:hypothetical protein